jgi:hypothetical protein
MAVIISFITSNWKALLIGGVLLGGVAYVEGLRLSNEHLTTKVQTLTVDNKTLSDNNTKLEVAIKTSNQALEASDKAAKAAAAGFAVIQHDILQQQSVLKQQLADILAQKDPATCNDAIVFLISNVPGYAK